MLEIHLSKDHKLNLTQLLTHKIASSNDFEWMIKGGFSDARYASAWRVI